ncbi:hypothetical protein K2173_007530 [Erythroxylum novogranatense]|uniref:Cytochrome P450 n=1 Tax=Erythroxylum novogranatense TaxID=1862640 RepID=A0AAV8T6G3_9ROSI|nr:hypothetical protein K2173_007530 [Erythroxylum novogranatense]
MVLDAMELAYLCLRITIAGILVLLLRSYCFKTREGIARTKTAPEPFVALPVIGHLPLLAGSKLLHRALETLADKYGPIFTLKFGMRQTLVVSSWEMAKEIFTINDIAVSARPYIAAVKHLSYDLAMFGFATYGPYWRETRKIATMEFLSTTKLEQLKHVRICEVGTSLKMLYKVWTEKKDASGHLALELKRWSGYVILNLILKMMVGKNCCGGGASALGECGEKGECRLKKGIREVVHYWGTFVVGDTVPFLGWFDVGGHERTMKKIAKELDDTFGEWLEEHRGATVLDEDRGEQDFMAAMLSALDGKNIGGHDADAINKATCLSLIAGGSDTSSVALVWAFSELLNNPRVLKKAQEELDLYVGRERRVTDSDISNLVYMQAIVKETLRLHPPAPLSSPREFIEDCTVGGYHISRGSWLMVNVWKIHRDPRVWEDPLEFKPERFLTTHKDVDVRGHNYELMPFGSGRRVCPGISFGLQMLHLVLATYLQAFEYSTPGSALVDMSESTGLTNMKATPLDVLIAPRLRPQLYE